jgi:rhodanese-related sulfurtransferase
MTTEPVSEVTAEQGRALVDAGALLLDVREADEWEAGHAPEATWIPVGDIQGRLGELSPDRRIVCICRSGARSRAVSEALLGAGYDIVNLDGGMRAWAAEDYTVVAADGLPGTVI